MGWSTPNCTESARAEAVQLWRQGYSTRQIAPILGCGRTTVRRLLHQEGLHLVRTELEHFQARGWTILPNGCWEWNGEPNADGYGVFCHDGKEDYAHRVSYRLFKGPIPPDKILDHRCDYKRCINPGHLLPSTHRENILRGTGTSARHAVKTHCHRGHPFDAENTAYYQPGRRTCRACLRIRERQRRAA